MNTLALDLGTKTGWTINCGDLIESGTWVLATPKELKALRPARMDRRNDPRIHKLFLRLAETQHCVKPDVVVFEDLEFSSYRLQMQLWSSLRAALWLSFPPASGTIVECVGVSTLKKFATGHGGATKDSMAKCLQIQCPHLYRPLMGDDAVDAAWLWEWARAHIKI